MSIPGSNIRTLRQQLNISLKTMAEALGMDKGGLSKLERGEQGYSREAIEKIAKILGVSVGVLFDEPDTVAAAVLRMRRIPLLTADSLALWRGPDADDGAEEAEILHGSVARMSRYVFAYRVPAGPGWAGFAEGDDLIFDAKGQPKHGAVVLAQNATGTVCVGRLRSLGSGDGFEVWQQGDLDPSASSRRDDTFTVRGVLVEERRYKHPPR